jgi:multidrug efflux pump subunit AcrA (membrane-fusion protein)
MSRREYGLMKVWWQFVVGAACCLVVVFGCTRNGGPDAGAEPETVPVETVKVTEREFAYNIKTVGTLVALHESRMGPKVGGKVTEILVDQADTVGEGDVLLRIDESDIRAAVNQAEAAVATARAGLNNLLAGTRKEDIASAKAAYEHAEKAYERMRGLWEKRSIPKERLDGAEAQYKMAKETYEKAVRGPRDEDIEVAKAQVKQAEAAREQARTQLENATVRAPFDGTIIAKLVNVGEMIGPERALFFLVNISVIKVECDIPEVEFAWVTKGTPAFISVDAYPGEEFRGGVSLVNPAVDPITRTFHIKMEIPNPGGTLKPGMFARIRLETRRSKNPAVPLDTLRRLPGTGVYYVFTISEGKAQQKNVETGMREANWVVIEDGLELGEEVIVTGGGQIKSGVPVTVVAEKGEAQ